MVQDEDVLKKKIKYYVDKFEADKIAQEPSLVDFF